jgi:hypothetical protein
MAQFQYRNNTPVPAAITTVVGSALPLKLIPGQGERVPIPLALTPADVARIGALNVRASANFMTFSVTALKAGSTALTANATTRPVLITVVDQLSLPAADTEAGLYARVFLAEVRSPGMPNFIEADVDDAMIMMRAVIENRLRTPSHLWASDGARSIFDVIRRQGQFRGFGAYPTVAAEASGNIAAILAVANDGADPRSPAYRRFVTIALNIARRGAVADPSGTRLYFWRTEGSGSPSPRVELYRSILGNSFYRMKRD